MPRSTVVCFLSLLWVKFTICLSLTSNFNFAFVLEVALFVLEVQSSQFT